MTAIKPLCIPYNHMINQCQRQRQRQRKCNQAHKPTQSDPKTSLYDTTPTSPSSNIVIVILEVNIPRPTAIRSNEIAVPRRPLVARVRRQHTLNTHADALDRLHGRPSSRAEQVQADNPVAVDVRVDGDWAPGVRGCCCCCCCGQFDELDLGGF